MEGELQTRKNDNWSKPLIDSIEHLKLENELLECFLKIVDPEILANFAQEFDELIAKVLARERIRSAVSMMMSRGLRSSFTLQCTRSLRKDSLDQSSLLTQHTSLADEPNQIPEATKLAIAKKVCTVIADAVHKLKASNEKKRRIFAVEIEEGYCRVKEISLLGDMFEETVVKEGTNPITGKIRSETFLNFISAQLKKFDQQVVLLCLFRNTLLRKLNSLHTEMPFLEDMRQHLRDVDVDIQEISSEQALQRLEEQEMQIPKRKIMLVQFRKKLQLHVDSSGTMEHQLHETENSLLLNIRQIEQFRSEMLTVEKQEHDARNEHERVKQLVSEYRAPDVLSYMETSQKLGELQKQLSKWQKKKEIQNVTFKSIKNDLGTVMKQLPESLRSKCKRNLSDDTELIQADTR